MKSKKTSMNYIDFLIERIVDLTREQTRLKIELARLERLTAEPTPRPKRRRPKHLSVIVGGRAD